MAGRALYGYRISREDAERYEKRHMFANDVKLPGAMLTLWAAVCCP